ncbi:MAG TPA: hypothetical protein VGH76_21330 [Actinomycetospora sp.]|uniref:hypothetical protein n=1 Tax=Actinomycetospora sp. TaxID=1872135 RepID=UPI002F413E8A
MSAPSPADTHVSDPWWWSPDTAAGREHGHPPTCAAVLLHDGTRATVRCHAGTTAAALRGLDPAALGHPETVVLEVGALLPGPATARAVAALRVRLLVRGVRVELRHPSPEVLAAVGGAPDARYQLVEGPDPASG